VPVSVLVYWRSGARAGRLANVVQRAVTVVVAGIPCHEYVYTPLSPLAEVIGAVVAVVAGVRILVDFVVAVVVLSVAQLGGSGKDGGVIVVAVFSATVFIQVGIAIHIAFVAFDIQTQAITAYVWRCANIATKAAVIRVGWQNGFTAVRVVVVAVSPINIAASYDTGAVSARRRSVFQLAGVVASAAMNWIGLEIDAIPAAKGHAGSVAFVENNGHRQQDTLVILPFPAKGCSIYGCH
jgi:hypothetical protein